jgi:hypothetical protein
MSNDKYTDNRQEIDNLEEEIVLYIKSRSVKKILHEIFLMNTEEDETITPGNSALGQVFSKEEDLGLYVANILQSNDYHLILETLKNLRTEIKANNKIVINILKTTFILDLLTNLLTKYEEQISIYILYIIIDLMGEADVKAAYFLTPKYFSILNLLLKQNSEILSEQVLKLTGLLVYHNTFIDIIPDSSITNELKLISKTLYSIYEKKHPYFVITLKRMLFSDIIYENDKVLYIAYFMFLLESNNILIKCLFYFELLQRDGILQKRTDEGKIILIIHKLWELFSTPEVIISCSRVLINTLKVNNNIREYYLTDCFYSELMIKLIELNDYNTLVYLIKTFIDSYEQQVFDNNYYVDLIYSIFSPRLLNYVIDADNPEMSLIMVKVFKYFIDESDSENLFFCFDKMWFINWKGKLDYYSKICDESDKLNIIGLLNNIT